MHVDVMHATVCKPSISGPILVSFEVLWLIFLVPLTYSKDILNVVLHLM